ncbi:MAG: ABC transporter ATP-binding protein [Proteobacteria bacterium]|nr:ABC transporter ATP-binding protein [Pseudomonadota bacterium]
MKLLVNNISKYFDHSKAVIEDISLVVQERECVGLLGPSGCGKSTLLRIIAGLESASKGEIHFDHECWVEKDFSLSPEKRLLGMLFQNYALWPHMSVLQNVSFPLKMQKKSKTEQNKQALNALEKVHLSDMAERMPGTLSGGQQQRVALARLLAQNPRLMLLDEPLCNLDASLKGAMRKEIRSIQQESNLSAILVTHDWADVEILCDRVYVIHQGKILQEGTPKDIKSRPANRFVEDLLL